MDWMERVLLGLHGLLVAGIVVLLLSLPFAIKEDAERQRRFMEQCMQDHKEYECVALWREGEPDTVPVLIPMPIVTR